eukprot:scaffold39121_cov139-Skeletonema_marinoi.AAC.4
MYGIVRCKLSSNPVSNKAIYTRIASKWHELVHESLCVRELMPDGRQGEGRKEWEKGGSARGYK